MAFPSKYLQPDEELVVDLKPHWWHLALPTFCLVSTIVLGLLSLATVRPVQVVAAVLILVALVYFALNYARWVTTNFVITNERIIYRAGLVARRGTEMPLEKINTVDFHQSVFERLLGAGDLMIESGSEAGTETFNDVRKPREVQQELTRLMDAKEKRNHAVPATVMAAPPTIPDQIAQLAQLRDNGVLTEAEFQTKKAELLGRL